MDKLSSIFDISGSAMRAQGLRLRTIAENLANRESTSAEPGGSPYRRRVVTFKNEMDRAAGINYVRVDKVVEDRSNFQYRFNPSHPSAGIDGYVKYPNVNSLIEMADMREATRSYEANLGVIQQSKDMLMRTIEMLR